MVKDVIYHLLHVAVILFQQPDIYIRYILYIYIIIYIYTECTRSVHVTAPAKKLKQGFTKEKKRKEKRETSSESEPHRQNPRRQVIELGSKKKGKKKKICDWSGPHWEPHVD